MANNIQARPWFVDTVGVIWQPQVFVKFIEWYNPTAQGQLLSITDRNGHSIVDSIAQVGGDVQTFNLENWFEGITLATLQGGNLRIHVK